MEAVEISAQDLERFRSILGEERYRSERDLAEQASRRLAGRTIWNVNSTAAGGGVAEMLRALLPYARGTGVDARWVVIAGSPEFFLITKRIHHALHGSAGDGSELGEEARRQYEAVMQENAAELTSLVRPGDVVLLHDPQTAGLVPLLKRTGALVIWRCHIGHDASGPEVDEGWNFLSPYLRNVPAFVFSRHQYVPTHLDRDRAKIITPSIDPFSPKNEAMDEATVRAILVHVGLVEGPPGDGRPVFTLDDGSPGRVDRRADVIRLGRAPTWDRPLIVQVSRWDPLKDPIGVLRGFTELISAGKGGDASLVLAGPNVHAVADDPEGGAVFGDVLDAWRELPHAIRTRIHLASLPMADLQENAAIVNALQRHAAVVVQKSLREGFGLTVTEAMWKSRPVIASAVGGIQEQIDDGVHGLLLKEPADLDEFGRALERLLSDREYAQRLGDAAHERVRDEFLALQHLLKYASLIAQMDGSSTL